MQLLCNRMFLRKHAWSEMGNLHWEPLPDLWWKRSLSVKSEGESMFENEVKLKKEVKLNPGHNYPGRKTLCGGTFWGLISLLSWRGPASSLHAWSMGFLPVSVLWNCFGTVAFLKVVDWHPFGNEYRISSETCTVLSVLKFSHPSPRKRDNKSGGKIILPPGEAIRSVLFCGQT